MKKGFLAFVIVLLIATAYSFALETVQIKLHINLDASDTPVDVSGRSFALYPLPDDDALLFDTTKSLEHILFLPDAQLQTRYGAPVMTGNTDVNGVVLVDGLEEKTYLVRETGSGKDYFVVMPFLLDVKNPSVYPKLASYKNGCIDIQTMEKGTNKPLSGAVFKLVRIDGDHRQDVLFSDGEFSLLGSIRLVSDAKGKIHLENLIAGQYQLVLIKGLPGYTQQTSLEPFFITPDQKTCTLLHVIFEAKGAPETESEPPVEEDPGATLPETGEWKWLWEIPVFLLLMGLFILSRSEKPYEG